MKNVWGHGCGHACNHVVTIMGVPYIAGNFCRVKFSQMVDHYHFTGLIFTEACTRAHYELYNRLFHRFNFCRKVIIHKNLENWTPRIFLTHSIMRVRSLWAISTQCRNNY